MTAMVAIGLLMIFIGILGIVVPKFWKRLPKLETIDQIALIIIGFGHLIFGMSSEFQILAIALVGLGCGLAMGFHLAIYKLKVFRRQKCGEDHLD